MMIYVSLMHLADSWMSSVCVIMCESRVITAGAAQSLFHAIQSYISILSSVCHSSSNSTPSIKTTINTAAHLVPSKIQKTSTASFQNT